MTPRRTYGRPLRSYSLDRPSAEADPAFAALVARVARLEAFVLPLDLDHVLHVVATATSGTVFTVKELIDHARVDEPLRRVLQRFDGPKQVGKLLQRVAATGPRGAYRLERVGLEHRVALWRVVVVE